VSECARARILDGTEAYLSSWAEAVLGLLVGACLFDAVLLAARRAARPSMPMSCPSSLPTFMAAEGLDADGGNSLSGFSTSAADACCLCFARAAIAAACEPHARAHARMRTRTTRNAGQTEGLTGDGLAHPVTDLHIHEYLPSLL
jgi:hypothetical protein